MEYLILGNGIAGTCAAESVRAIDTQGRITMVADEDCIPYSRPMISMLLANQVSSEKLPIRSPNFYHDLKINTVFGDRAGFLVDFEQPA